MKIRLLATDSKIPNIAIMKISTFHKKLGDDVDWYNPVFDMIDTDILYISKIFTFSDDPLHTIPMPLNAEIKIGGTGYDVKSKLPQEIECITDYDYSLYPDCDYSIIFTTRGCIRHCSFCLVRDKEGLIHDVEIPKLNPKGKYIRIQDNNFFASKTWKDRLEIIKGFNQPIDFNGGLDLRIMTEEMCIELKKCRIKSIKVAFDDIKDKEAIMPKLKMLASYIKPRYIICYILVGNKADHLLEEDIERVNLIWETGVYPFIMPYVDYNDTKRKIPQDIKDFARWCNNRFIFKTTKWKDYNKKTITNREENLFNMKEKKMANHKIKIKEEYYTEITSGKKTFELRKNDRNYQEGDTIEFIVLKENGEQTPSSRIYKITYILKDVPEYGLADGFCIFSIREL